MPFRRRWWSGVRILARRLRILRVIEEQLALRAEEQRALQVELFGDGPFDGMDDEEMLLVINHGG